MSEFGLTALGFNPMQLQDILSEIQADLQTTFGANINFGAESVISQFVGIFAEREALLWQLGDAIYASQYPAGAEGTSVDNILALNNLKRLKATATTTNPTPLVQANGITLYGLVLYGTPGTVIPAGSTIQTTATPALSFTLQNQVIIASAANTQESVFFSNIPTTGSFALSIVDPAGNTLTMASVPYTGLAAQTLLSISTTPGSSSGFKLVLTQAGVALTTATISTNSAYPTAGAIQSAIQALSGYSGVTVAGGAGSYTITWGSIANPLTTVTSNTTGATITPTDSLQAAFNNLHDSTAANYPYTDVVITGSFASQGFVFTFGSGTAVGANPVSSHQPQALMLQSSNTLQNGGTVTNINIVTTATGAPAQGVGQATCTVTGPNFVKAGTLTVIGTPVSGWTSVTNQLDCITGSNVETDVQSLQRRSTLLASQANGPIQAIVEKVRQVSGVTTAIGFSNLTGAAQQTITFSAVPVSGHWAITLNGQTTSNLAYNAAASDVQLALQALSGYSTTLVTGNVQYGFVIDWNGGNGGQAVSLVTISNNTTGVTITPAFGRPPKSFEIVVQGGTDTAVAQAIYASQPGGIQAYGAPVLNTTGTTTNGSTSLSSLGSTQGLLVGMGIIGQGIPPGTTIVSVGVGSVVMSLAAISSNSGIAITFNHTVTILDAFNNPVQIAFSRPTQIPIYVTIALTTDLYNIPGNSGSGANPNAQFSPQSIPTIQNDIATIGNSVVVGGLIIGFGSDGLIGAFNDVPGIVSYTLYFGTSPSPGANTNIQMLAEQVPLFEEFNIIVSYT